MSLPELFRPVLHILIGNVSSGKSTFAYNLQEYQGGEKDIIYLSSDAFRGVIGEGETDQTVSRQVFQVLEWNVEYFLKHGHQDIIIDAISKTPKARKIFIDIGKRYEAKIVGYYFNVPMEICKERNAKRERVVPNEIIERFQRELVAPMLGEGFDEINFVNVDGAIYSTINEI